MSRDLPKALVAHVCALAVAAAALLALLGRVEFDIPTQGTFFWNTIAALVGLALLSEFFSLQIRVGTSTSAVSFIPYLAAILTVGPAWAMLIAGGTELFSETVVRRKPLIKIVHNTTKEIVAVGTAGLFFLAAGGASSIAEFHPPIPEFVGAFVGAAVLYFLVSNGATATAVALSTKASLSETWGQMVGRGLAQDVLSSSLAPLLAFVWIELQLLGLLLIAVPLFFVRHALRVNLQLEQTNRELLELMVKSIEARDPYTSGHSVRVAKYAKAIARSIGLPAKDIEHIETAALLHDVGKIHEEFAAILRKETALSASERELIRSHPVKSAELVRTISALRGYVERCVRAHHENYDGGGYPDGLVAEEIPIGARIIMVADTVDAMMTDRPYRRARTYDAVVQELETWSGLQFDARIVEAFKGSTAIRRLVEEWQSRHPDQTDHDDGRISLVAP
jgi:putative nucleotidyltransferase with HDIG domain